MKQRIHQTMALSLSTVLSAAGQYMPRFALALLVLFLVHFGQAPGAWAANYHGQVVDAETGKPIEGAVVMVEWHKKPRIAMGGISYFHDAREALTDPDGKFSLDSSPGIDWNPFTYVQEPWIIAFYPGYRAFTAAHPEDIDTKSDLNKIAEAFERGVVVKLAKVTSEKELRYFTSKSGFGPIMAPYTLIPNLLRLINIQRKMLGIDEFKLP